MRSITNQSKFALSIVLLLCSFLGYSQKEFTSRFQNYSVNDGLPSSQVYQIIQDSRGYIWFGTDRGLVKYNGYEFEVFTVNDGLTSNVVFHLDEGPDGSIWFYGKDRKLNYYKDGDFYEFKYNDSLVTNITNKSNLLSFDVHEKGLNVCLWDEFETDYYFELTFEGDYTLQSEGEGIFILEDETGIRVSHNSRDLQKVYYNGELLYGFPEVLIEYSSFSDVVRFEEFIYLSVGNWMIKFWKTKEGEVEWNVFTFPTEILDLGNDAEGNILIGHRGGLIKWYAGDQIRFKNLIKDQQISSVLVDKDGGVWASSLFQGLFYSKNPEDKHILHPKNRVVDLFKCGTHLYYSQLNGELVKLTADGTYPLELSDEPIPEGGAVRNDALTVAGLGGFGTHLIDTVNNVFWRIKEHVRAVENVPTGHIFLSSEGIEYFSAEFVNRAAYFADGFLNCGTVYYDRIQIFGLDDGVKTCNLNNQTSVKEHLGNLIVWKMHLSDHRPEIPFFRTSINAILKVDDSVYLYASEESGLYIERKGQSDIILDEESGLISSLLDNVYYDEGYIAVGSKEGMSVISQEGEIINYTANNSLLSNEVVSGVIKDSVLWVASSAGISKVPIKRRPNPEIPVHLVEVKIDGEKHHLYNQYKLRHSAKTMDISFEALSYIAEGDIDYRYQLKGVDNGWVYTKNRSVRYTNLPAGNFSFSVSVQNPDKSWSNPVALFTLIKYEPFWKHWLFISGAILLVILIIIMVILLIDDRRKRIQRDKLALLNLERKTLQAQMNPHFVFNSLTSLQNLIIKDQKIESQEFLGKFAGLSRLALNQSAKNQISLQEEVDLLEYYIALEQIRFGNNFEHQIIINLSDQKIKFPPMLLQPFVENAILHGLAPKESDGLLEIVFNERDETTILCIIRDNGVGRGSARKKSSHKSMGIRLIKERLQILLKRDAVEIIDLTVNEQPAGTEVRIILPIKNNTIESADY